MSSGEVHTDDCGANAAPYVLGALTEEEHADFRRHMEGCAVCREEVAALAVVVDSLPAAAPQLLAPVELKGRVMATVRAEAKLLPAAREARSAQPTRAGVLARLGLLGRRPAFAGLAATAAVVAIVAVALASGGGAGGTRVIRAEVLTPRASAQLRVKGSHAELAVAGLPAPPPNRIYEVWVKGAGAAAARPTNVLFTVTPRGHANVGVPGSIAGVKVVMVTSEPLGGSRVPTGAPVIVARLS